MWKKCLRLSLEKSKNTKEAREEQQAWTQQKGSISDLLSDISNACLLVDFWVVKFPSHIVSKSKLADALAKAALPKTDNIFFCQRKGSMDNKSLQPN